ncbi:MAG: hypothetical protein Q8P99_02835 [bacterium]|nr:hypothetical protein [bacterium]MDZ4231508.1 hypothetical protein [Patescibacteria group bacterium]
MKQKEYITFSGLLFTVVALVHLLRAVYGWPVVIGGWDLPMWASWLAVVVVGFLAWKAYKLNH